MISTYSTFDQGKMGFFSKGKGFGSTFFFELPLYSPHAAGSHLAHLYKLS